jgi:hypothetical protein
MISKVSGKKGILTDGTFLAYVETNGECTSYIPR